MNDMNPSVPLPENESARLERLQRLSVLDSAPEALFDHLTLLISEICEARFAILSLVDRDRLWFKSSVGVPHTHEISRDLAFCNYTILGTEIFEVPDAHLDKRFVDSAVVTEGPMLRFYAGAPIVLSDGFKVGVLCVADRQPRRLDRQQRSALMHLAKTTAELFELRERQQSFHEESLRHTQMEQLYARTPAMLYSINANDIVTHVSEKWLEKIGYERHEIIGHPSLNFFTQAGAERTKHHGFDTMYRAGGCNNIEFQAVTKQGQIIDVLLSAVVDFDAEHKPLRTMVLIEDISERRRAEEDLRASQRFLERIGEIGGMGGWSYDLASGAITWSDMTCRLHDVPLGYQPTIEEAIAFYTPEVQPVIRQAIQEGIEAGKKWDIEIPFSSARGHKFWVRMVGHLEYVNHKPKRLTGTFQDVTERHEMQNRLAQSLELLQITLDSIGDAVITTNSHGQILWLNPVAERMTGWTKEEAEGKDYARVFVVRDENAQGGYDPIQRCLTEKRIVTSSSHFLISRQHEEYGIALTTSPIGNDQENVLGAVLIFQDVTAQRRMTKEMNYRATHDVLTGLYNRSEFEERLDNLRLQSGTSDCVHVLMYLDLDHFKLINDACGHSVGDRLLRQVTNMLLVCVREGDVVARLGGDEFGIILQNCPLEQAQRVAQKLCDQLEEFRFIHEERRFRIGASVGLVQINAHWSSTLALMQAADTSCYTAKEQGRNRVCVWFDSDQAMRLRQVEMQWVSRIEQALDENRFVLHGQRIHSLQALGQGLHFEVLLRLRDIDDRLIYPGSFFPAVERFFMATRVDRWVIKNTFDWLADLGACIDQIELVSINLSGLSIGDPSFHRDLLAMLDTISFDRRKLCFEITETAAITHMAVARTFIQRLRSLGIKIALDDFGAGASSFGYLKNLTVDYLKIDGQFIQKFLIDPLDHAAVRCFQEVAAVVGVQTIAEFVESDEVSEALQKMGVHYAQGYLIHRPEPLANLFAARAKADVAWLEQRLSLIK